MEDTITYRRLFQLNRDHTKYNQVCLTELGNVQILNEEDTLLWEFPETEIDLLFRILLSVKRARQEDVRNAKDVKSIVADMESNIAWFLEDEALLDIQE